MSAGLRARSLPRRLTEVFALAALIALPLASSAQTAASPSSGSDTVTGMVVGDQGEGTPGALVELDGTETRFHTHTLTDAAGRFAFANLPAGRYRVRAEKSGRNTSIVVSSTPATQQSSLRLVLGPPMPPPPGKTASSPAAAMQFADQPSFTIAGVTDWTAVGGHGSDTILRTSEDLARQTATLDSARPGAPDLAAPSEASLRSSLAAAPDSFDANYRLGAFCLRAQHDQEALPLLQKAHRIDPANHAAAADLALALQGTGNDRQALDLIRPLLAAKPKPDLLRLAGELEEKLNDPLAAVRDFQQAAAADPSEQNLFALGSDLLLHRAVWEAQEIFRKGVSAYPKSVRMQTGLAAALFAGALYQEAALHLCQASDLDPARTGPYLFMGRIEIVAPHPLQCIQSHLARFASDRPEDAQAQYLYAMSVLKPQSAMSDAPALRRAEDLLHRATSLDAGCAEAWLELGILAAARADYAGAVAAYTRAISADPQLSDAHYRLALAYDRMGETARAREQFRLHDQIEKNQASAIDRQRREIKQFLVVQSGAPGPPLPQ